MPTFLVVGRARCFSRSGGACVSLYLESESSHICRVDTRLYCRRKGKSSAAVHASNLVVLESGGEGDLAEDGELEMGNKSSGGFSPADGKKQSGRWLLICLLACMVHLATFSSYQVMPYPACNVK